MRLIVFYFSFGIMLFSIVACDKEMASSGNGGFGYQILSLGLRDWNVNEVKVFSGSEGIILNGMVRGGGLKKARIVMVDTISNTILYENIRSTFIADQFSINDTVYVVNVVDTLFAKITLEGMDENETDQKHWRLKIIR